jgi:hypothetical protein
VARRTSLLGAGCLCGRLPASVRVGLEVGLPSAAVGDVRVALGRAEICVPQHLLHTAQVGTAFEQVRRERVAQQMRMDTFWLETGSLCESTEDEEGPRARQRPSSGVQEELRSRWGRPSAR